MDSVKKTIEQREKNALLEIIRAYRIGWVELGRHMRQQLSDKPLERRYVFALFDKNGKSSFSNFRDQFIPAINKVLEERRLEERYPLDYLDRIGQ